MTENRHNLEKDCEIALREGDGLGDAAETYGSMENRWNQITFAHYALPESCSSWKTHPRVQ